MHERQRFSTRQAATYVGLSPRTLEKLRIAGGGPEYFKPNRRVVYDQTALDAWLTAYRRRSTSDKGATAPIP